MLERRIGSAARGPGARARPALAAACALAAALLVADGAQAARLLGVRVGRHTGFVRIVFDTDAPARFALEPRVDPAEVRVRIEAADPGARVSLPPGARTEVRLEPLPDGATLARIRAAEPVVVESQVVANPPRLVFDLRPGAPALAQEAPAPPQQAPPDAGGPRDVAPDAPEPGGSDEIAELLAEGETPSAVEPSAPEAPPALAVEPSEEAEGPILAPEVREPSILSDLAPRLEPETAPGLEPEPAPEPESASGKAPELAPEAAPELPPAPEPLPGLEPPPEPESTPEPETPAVSAPPPAALAPQLDDRSLVLGAAGGLALGIGLALIARGRPARDPRAEDRELAHGPMPPPLDLAPAPAPPGLPSPAPAPPAPAPPANEPRPPPAAPPAPDRAPIAAPGSDLLAADVLAMLQRLDERCLRTEESVAALLERAERLERRGAVQADELRAQRAALARLDRALGRPASSPAHPAPAAATPPRER